MKVFQDYRININGGSGEVLSTCPECSHSRKKKSVKCLSVNIEKEVWFCHHCGWSGSLKNGIENKAEIKRSYRKLDYQYRELPDKVVSWFKDRGISFETLELMSIGYSKNYISQIEDFTNTIDFPYFKNSNVVNIKHRTGDKKFSQEKNAEKILYNLDNIRQNNENMAFIVEGEIDTLSLIEVGIMNVVSVPDGAPAVNSKHYNLKFEYLDKAKDIFDKIECVVLACDNDEPGKLLTNELARRIGKEKCYFVEWPKGIKDANEALKEHGKEFLAEILSKPTQFPIDGIIEPYQIKDNIIDLYTNGLKSGLSTGFLNLNEFYTVRTGEFTTVTGIPGHGKSEIMDAFVVNMATRHNWGFALFSPENYPLWRHSAKLIEKIKKKPFNIGQQPRMNIDELTEAIEFMQNNIFFIFPKEDEMNLDKILELSKALIFRKGIKGIVIDPWNELEHHRGNNQTETEYISECLSKIRRFARVNDVHIWIIAHPTKLQKDKEGNYPIPTPYDISGSAHWRNKSDNCLTIWREIQQKSGKVKIFIQKIRFKEVGCVGEAELGYDYITGCFSNV